MKFIHFADCHLGGYREPKLNVLSLQSFRSVIDSAIDRNVDFVLLAGDLFNTALPSVEILKFVLREFKRLKVKNIPLYFIAGSHDFSPNNKTMLEIIEETELGINVFKGIVDGHGKLKLKFTTDINTGTKITGIIGKKGMLDKKYYEDLEIEDIQSSDSKKIFLFHTSISEMLPQDLSMIESTSSSFLPKGFDYYAGGHIHITKKYENNLIKNVVYPGPTFPNNFRELEELKCGSYAFYDDSKSEQVTIEKLDLKNIEIIDLDCDDKSPLEVEDEVIEKINDLDLKDSLLLIRLSGVLEGISQEINFKEIFKVAYDKGAYFIMKNSMKLRSREFEEIENTVSDPEDIENFVMETNNVVGDEAKKIKELMAILSMEQYDGERKTDYVDRLNAEMNAYLELDDS